MTKRFAALLAALLLPAAAAAQSVLTPITQGLVWTPTQWTTAWTGKQDYPATTAIPMLNWSTASRPSTPLAGYTGFNTTGHVLEYWNGSAWTSASGGGTAANPTAQVGNTVVNGSATTFMRSDAAPPLASGAALTNLGLSSSQGAGLKLQRSTGTATSGHCVQFDATGNTVDAGGACTTGGGGGTVSAGLAHQSAVYATDGTVVSGLSGLNLPFGPSISTSPTGNPTGGSLLTTYSTGVMQGTTSNASNREFLVNIGLTSNNGNGVANNNGDKVALYVGAVGNSGTGDLWAFNPLLTQSAASGTYNAQVLEVDLNNFNADRGGSDGSAGMPANVANGISISGAGDSNNYTNTAGVAIDSFGGADFAHALYSRGLNMNGYYKFAAVADYSQSPIGYEMYGGYTYGLDGKSGVFASGFIRAPNNQNAFLIRNAANSADNVILKLDTSNNLSFATTGVAGTFINSGFYPQTSGTLNLGQPTLQWANVYAVTGVFSSSAFINSLPVPAISGGSVSGDCVKFGTGNTLVDTGAACGSGGAVSSVLAGSSNVTVSPTTGNVVVNLAASPSVTSLGVGTSSITSTLTVNGTMAVSSSAAFNSAVSVAGSVQFSAFGAGCLQTNSSGIISVGACSGGGTVSGPVSSTSGNFPTWNGTGGTVLANSAYGPSSFVAASAGTATNVTLSGSVSHAGSTSYGEDFTGGTYSVATIRTGNNKNPLVARNAANNADVVLVNLDTSNNEVVCGAGCAGFFSAAGVYPTVDNSFLVGQSSARWSAVWAVNGTIQTSDLRSKKNVIDSDLGLTFVRSLRPVRFDRNEEANGTNHYGLIAQELDQALNGKAFAGLRRPPNDKERYGLVYDELVAPLISSVQELANDNDQLRARIARLEARN